MAESTPSDTIARLRAGRRIWAIASVHGVAPRLAALAARIVPKLQPRDGLVFLGNLVGGPPGGEPSDVAATLDIALKLRRTVLAGPGARACDVVFLRGAQEEMWSKLDQLHFAVNPRDVLRWMLHHGVGATIEAYAGREAIAEGLRAVSGGPMTTARWTGALRHAVRAHAGHEPLYTAVKRAALSEDGRLLFVNHGVDPTRPLDRQGDSFWWGAAQPFERIAEPFGGVQRAVRGFDRGHPGVVSGAVGMTVDGGCGFGGPLFALLFDRDGRELDRLAV
jgi:serine/threonine protein phosphatase 1